MFFFLGGGSFFQLIHLVSAGGLEFRGFRGFKGFRA